jgi:hypothetical protein
VALIALGTGFFFGCQWLLARIGRAISRRVGKRRKRREENASRG